MLLHARHAHATHTQVSCKYLCGMRSTVVLVIDHRDIGSAARYANLPSVLGTEAIADKDEDGRLTRGAGGPGACSTMALVLQVRAGLCDWCLPSQAVPDARTPHPACPAPLTRRLAEIPRPSKHEDK